MQYQIIRPEASNSQKIKLTRHVFQMRKRKRYDNEWNVDSYEKFSISNSYSHIAKIRLLVGKILGSKFKTIFEMLTDIEQVLEKKCLSIIIDESEILFDIIINIILFEIFFVVVNITSSWTEQFFVMVQNRK